MNVSAHQHLYIFSHPPLPCQNTQALLMLCAVRLMHHRLLHEVDERLWRVIDAEKSVGTAVQRGLAHLEAAAKHDQLGALRTGAQAGA